MSVILNGLNFTLGLIIVSDKTKDSVLGRILTTFNLLGNLIVVSGGVFVIVVGSIFNFKSIFAVFSIVYILLYIFKCLLYAFIYICFGNHEKVATTIKKALFFNIVFIATLIGLMVYLASLKAKTNTPNAGTFIPSSAKRVFMNDGSLTLTNEKVNASDLYSHFFTATIRNKSIYSLNNVVVELLVLDPASQSCSDKVVDTIKFEILKYDDYKTLDKGASRMIRYDFGFNQRDYPTGWKTCSSVLGGTISGLTQD